MTSEMLHTEMRKRLSAILCAYLIGHATRPACDVIIMPFNVKTELVQVLYLLEVFQRKEDTISMDCWGFVWKAWEPTEFPVLAPFKGLAMSETMKGGLDSLNHYPLTRLHPTSVWGVNYRTTMQFQQLLTYPDPCRHRLHIMYVHHVYPPPWTLGHVCPVALHLRAQAPVLRLNNSHRAVTTVLYCCVSTGSCD